ncbi:TniB family NTP-binding protein [Thiohalomonas denitrificans]|uniref:TniB protein n=1 Tax=Thiohalomonas denitrificans TaxID=415747 RepID=A0A1G5QT25_9GAMM|nr:TniB family NTP-binding protein [Thiohalomonas denitrificans]SCZ64690.1 TniB protein [Thiohalomonas denitrificans]
MTEAQHVDERFRDWLWVPTEERIEKIQRPRWINYPQARRALLRMEELLSYPRVHRMPNLLVVGDTNNGKTMLIERFLRKYPVDENACGESVQMPVVAIQAPPLPDENRLYSAILRAINAPHSSSDNAGKKQDQVYDLLPVIGAKILIIDEIQHLLAGAPAAQRRFLNALKHLGNELRIPIVAFGVPEGLRAIQSDSQLANRFQPIPLYRWKRGTEFLRLLSSFERFLPLRKKSNLAKEPIAGKLLSMSEGVIGELGAVLEMAAIHAIRSGKEQIDMDVLNQIGWISPSQRRLRTEAFV